MKAPLTFHNSLDIHSSISITYKSVLTSHIHIHVSNGCLQQINGDRKNVEIKAFHDKTWTEIIASFNTFGESRE